MNIPSDRVKINFKCPLQKYIKWSDKSITSDQLAQKIFKVVTMMDQDHQSYELITVHLKQTNN